MNVVLKQDKKNLQFTNEIINYANQLIQITIFFYNKSLQFLFYIQVNQLKKQLFFRDK